MNRFAKTVSGALALTLMTSAAWAGGMGGGSGGQSNSVRWDTIIGIIQASNTVGGITGGAQPWSTLGGHAYVNLSDSVVDFEVKGLVLAGGNSIGTPGPVKSVEGALVCSPASSPTVFYTKSVTLDGQGNASFDGSFKDSTAACSPSAVAFLIVVTSNGHWIANGAVQVPYP